MASEKGPVATEPPLAAASAPQTAGLPSAEAFAADAGRARPSLKRAREATPTSPTSGVDPASSGADLSPSKIARLVGFARGTTPAVLIGAAALEDERRLKEEESRLEPPGMSTNPAQSVVSALTMAMSRPQDAPPQSAAPPILNLDVTRPPNSTIVPPAPTANVESRTTDISPQSATSIHSLTGGGGPMMVSSPGPMDIDSRNDRPYAPQPDALMDDKTSTSLSYPGMLPPGGVMPAPAPPQRGMSLPMSSSQNPELAPRSPSSKKHKCPYCETEFTRHHNLKSHLLTHSQEKPYSCHTCQMRFRRLHDLKRHEKLHTGEKPHVCPKCDRKFARGDALARHSKGAGGCAGRRTSMGSFAGDDDFEGNSMGGADDSMTGVLYDGAHDTDLTEEDRRRLSLPAIKAQHVAGGQPAPDGYGPHARTYPPAGPRPGTTSGGLYPPQLDRGGLPSAGTSPSMQNSMTSGHTPGTSISSMPLSAGSSSNYSQGITESPKPLSPGAMHSHQLGHEPVPIARQRSPSLTTQLQQGQFGRRPSDRQTSPGVPLSQPHGLTAGHAAAAAATATGNSGQPSVVPAAVQARPAGGPAHGSSAAGGDISTNLFAAGESGIWSYIQSLEEKVKVLSDKVSTWENAQASREAQIGYLTNEVSSLRRQLEQRQPDNPLPKAN